MTSRKLAQALFLVLLVTTGSAWAGAGSTPAVGIDAGGKIEKINLHALKSAVLVRQLLARNGVSAVAR